MPPTTTVQQIADAIDRVRDQNPDARILVPEHCDGDDWLVDSCCAIIYISGHLRGAAFLEALAQASDALARDTREQARKRLRIVVDNDRTLGECRGRGDPPAAREPWATLAAGAPCDFRKAATRGIKSG